MRLGAAVIGLTGAGMAAGATAEHLWGLDPLIATPVLIAAISGLLYLIKLVWDSATKSRGEAETLRTSALQTVVAEVHTLSGEMTRRHDEVLKELKTTRHEARQDRTVLRGDIGTLRLELTQGMAEIAQLKCRVDRTEQDIKDIKGMLGDRRQLTRSTPP